MNIIMTGATGLIGKKLGIELVKRGHHLTALVRNVEKAKLELPFPCKLITWDSDKKIEQSLLLETDSIVHLAGESVAGPRWTKKRKQKIYNSRVLGTKNLVDSVLESGKKLNSFVSGSAIGYYGDAGDELLSETASCGQGFLAQVCFDWENTLKPLASLTRLSIVRTGIVLTHEGGALKELLPIFRTGGGGAIGSGKQWMSWIHIDDIVQIFANAVEKESYSGIINGVSPHPVTNQEFSQTLAKIMGTFSFMKVPSIGIKLGLGEQSEIILGGQKVNPKSLQRLGYAFKFEKLSNALNQILEPLRHPKTKKIVDTLTAYQWVPKKRSELFPFFSEAKNLEKLTPDFIGFKITNESKGPMAAGKLIEYDLKLHGIPIHWKTEITEWNEGKSFIDNQIKGPYSLWHHKHEFEDLGGGTLMTDHVRYKIPAGALGKLFAGWKVKSDVTEIFSYRKTVIQKLFG